MKKLNIDQKHQLSGGGIFVTSLFAIHGLSTCFTLFVNAFDSYYNNHKIINPKSYKNNEKLIFINNNNNFENLIKTLS